MPHSSDSSYKNPTSLPERIETRPEIRTFEPWPVARDRVPDGRYPVVTFWGIIGKAQWTSVLYDVVELSEEVEKFSR